MIERRSRTEKPETNVTESRGKFREVSKRNLKSNMRGILRKEILNEKDRQKRPKISITETGKKNTATIKQTKKRHTRRNVPKLKREATITRIIEEQI